VCSGSEANDLAWRMACTAARRSGWAGPLHAVVIDHAYHGHTSATVDLSPYKFDGPGGAGCPEHVHVMPCPDAYRGTHLDGAAAARAALAEARAAGARVAMFIAESVVSCGGQVSRPHPPRPTGRRLPCTAAWRLSRRPLCLQVYLPPIPGDSGSS
jgi:ethanolamine-phosphate phospho-lyase